MQVSSSGRVSFLARRAEHILALHARKELSMAFEVPPLPYDYNALEPYIDEETMRLHHDKHHQAYVDNANKALEGTEWADRSVEDILADLEIIPEDKRAAVRNNVGGHANHSLFWEIMSPNGGGEPGGSIGDAIDSTFGSFAELKSAVNDGGVKRFGSGWTWLVYDGTGLSLYSTANQDSPIIQSDVPLLGIDVWEHAYYLKYQNRRPEYLEAWWNVVNWDAVQQRYESSDKRR
jgi:superoxide dismutase, Fe-Mn family